MDITASQRIVEVANQPALAPWLDDSRINRWNGVDWLNGQVRLTDDDGTITLYAFMMGSRTVMWEANFTHCPANVIAAAVHQTLREMMPSRS